MGTRLRRFAHPTICPTLRRAPAPTSPRWGEVAPKDQRARAAREILLRREARPDEIAPAAVFLLSDRLAGYITGSELIVDGGLRLRPIFGGTDAELAALNL